MYAPAQVHESDLVLEDEEEETKKDERKLKIGVVGATGMVGQTFMNILEEREFPIEGWPFPPLKIPWVKNRIARQSLVCASFERGGGAFLTA